jgi:AAA+ ATPase superfamily predicted ATPase
MRSKQGLLEDILCYLCRQPPGERVPLAELCEELGVPSREPVIEILQQLEAQGYVEVSALTPSAMLCRITYDGRKIVKDFERQDIAPNAPEAGVAPSAPGTTLLPTIGSDEPAPKAFAEYYELPWKPAELGLDPQCARIVERRDAIERIESVLEDPGEKRLVFLYGQPQVGKTFVLERLKEALQDRYVPVLIHLNGWTSIFKLPDFLYELGMNIKIEVELSCPGLEIRPVERRPRRYASAEFYRFMNELSRSMCTQGRPVLLLFDELEYLARGETDRRILEYLVGFVDRWSREARFVFGGSGNLLDWLRNTAMAPLLAKGQSVYVECFPSAVSRELVSALTAPYFALDPGAVDTIVRLTDGHPSLLRKALNIIFLHWQSEWHKKRVTEDDLRAVVQDILVELSPKTNDIWYRLSPPEKRILRRIAHGNKEKFEAGEVIGERPTYVQRDLRQLVKRQILNGDPLDTWYTIRLGILVQSISYGVLFSGG